MTRLISWPKVAKCLRDLFTETEDDTKRKAYAAAYCLIAQIPDPWISTKDRLPHENVPVLICREKEPGVPLVEQARYEGKMGGKLPWKVYGTRVARVTHWMPLPEPPEVMPDD